MSKIEEALAEARALRESLQRRLSAVEKSIAGLERLRREVPPDVLETILGQRDAVSLDQLQPPPAGDPNEPITPIEVVALARDELLLAGRPMKRGALVKVLAEKGAKLSGKDKNKNLGTILWRHPNDFVSIERLGYWVKGVPLEGVYDPERDDEPLPKTTFVPRR